jgi:hypothetical protein
MTHSLADKLRDGAKAYGWRNVNKTRYRRVDVPLAQISDSIFKQPTFPIPSPLVGEG